MFFTVAGYMDNGEWNA